MKVLIHLFSPPSGTYGSLTRTMAVAQKLKTAGHQVKFCASGNIADILINKGYEVFITPEANMLGLPKVISQIMVKHSQKLQLPVKEGKAIGSVWFVQVLMGMANKNYLLHLLQTQINATKSFKPDLLFTEMDPGAYLLASITNIPLMTTYATIAEEGIGSFFWKRVKVAMNYVLNHYGRLPMNPEEICFNPGIFKIIPSIPELDGADSDRADVCYVGNLLERVNNTTINFVPKEGKKYVFVYMGTGSISLSRVEKVLPKVFDGMDEYSCIVASQSIHKEYQIGNVEFKSYIQAEELLPNCEWTICHGGLNTITQSLEFKVPLLIFPGPIFERRFNARKVQEQNGGFMGELSDFNIVWLRDKIKRHQEILPQVQYLSERLNAYHGVNDVYHKMERLVLKDEL
jgi:UDP:flavonoid glycosyltransferase YjiC (YdhE family)